MDPPHRAWSAGSSALEETTEVMLSGPPGRSQGPSWGSSGSAADQPPAQPRGPALPRPTLRGLHPSARAPPECGLPNKSWNSWLGSDKEGPRQINAAGKPNPSPVYVRVWGHRGAC